MPVAQVGRMPRYPRHPELHASIGSFRTTERTSMAGCDAETSELLWLVVLDEVGFLR